MIYTVEMDAPSDNAVLECGAACGWTGHFDKVVEIEGCSLTPGDPSPAGRCPQCDSLVYPASSRHHSLVYPASS